MLDVPQDSSVTKLSVQEWADKIQNEGLSSFTETAQRISEIAACDDADLNELSKLIMRDAGMATKVLQASNSAFRMRKGKVSTVSHALVMLGVEEVKHICLASSFVDGLLQGSENQELIDEMSRTFHAATQSRLLALRRGDRRTEEVFIGALMASLGPLAFWRVGGEVALELKQRYESANKPFEVIERDFLGFALSELSDELARRWNLHQFMPKRDSEDRTECLRAIEVHYSTRLARYLARGWDDELVKELIAEMRSSLGLSEHAVLSVLTTAANETREAAMAFHLPEPSTLIPPPLAESSGSSAPISEVQDGEDEPKPFQAIDPDPLYQLKVLREISTLMQGRGELTSIIVKVLDGIYQGIGMDRVVFALLGDDRTTLTSRLALGASRNSFQSRFRFLLKDDEKNIFTYSSHHPAAIWYAKQQHELSSHMGERILRVIGSGDFFLAPLLVNGRWLGVFYADRRVSKRELDQESFDAFNQFVFQAIFAFSQNGGKFG
ncbi:MAG: HDOD domain-containing protein [Bdellovibrionales bacterium]|nr:HDOD domain-containing protein [Bdellovibrionales bacterium]